MLTLRKTPVESIYETSAGPRSTTEGDDGESTHARSNLSLYARSLNPTRQLLQAWIVAGLTTILLIMTAVYASQAMVVYRMRFLYSSSSNTIFVLSLLSGLTGFFLAATIAVTFERLQWLLISRRDGFQFTKLLSLHAGTGIPGLLLLATGRGLPLPSTTRLWSAGRLASIILVPVLGILVMSNVNTRMIFEAVDGNYTDIGWGMSPFNASLAKDISIIVDQVSQAQLSMFLLDPSRAVEITPSSIRSTSCSHGPQSQVGQSCNRTFFLPGGIEFAAPKAFNDPRLSQADVFLVKDQQGYVLDFQDGDVRWQHDDTLYCDVHGFPFAAFHLCLKNVADNEVEARIVHCPVDLATRSQCRSNTSWNSDPGWATHLTTSFRRATVAYSKANATIMSHTFSNVPAISAPINATGMLEAYRHAFGELDDLGDLFVLLADPEGTEVFPMYTYPAVVWWCLKGVGRLGSQNPALVTRAADTLYSLLAMVLYYCQASLYARAMAESAENSTAADEGFKQFATDILALAPPDTQVSLAEIRYQIMVGKATLITYVLLSSLALLGCLAVLALGSCTPAASRVPETSSFPVWNSMLRCKVEYGSGASLDHESNKSLRSLKGDALVREAARMKVKLIDDDEDDAVDDDLAKAGG